ncbi:DNA polymerase III subunit gamma/tau [Flectobacillus sp. DC10W]|jgi:DNA polymerase-3 subunit gamma/tau|uniref:DNA polymerase III subunit gamma/tau n=1 Tax=Flectobacillus longus TaxID=2984207 RepID=A0ABT6YTX6_9BACT|nr:DNA polymerase III subunit gamma/tau [Flectobacillus longus]MDI9867044.1 DNA polymerase III subunit gamma/tau [Flectobacillus longus]
MENFVVSARKYRPALFDSVVGQSHITTTLKNAIRTNHLAQAFLFCGPRGVGKTTCARILAKTINCQNLTHDAEACGECESCKSFQNNASFNIHELDAASNNSVDDIRNLIDQVRYPPQSGRYKIYIIDEVHMLSTSAFNAFLKTLEEPPAYAIFILATTEKHKILPTILSRCQIFDFNRIQIGDMTQHLANIAAKEGIIAEWSALELISQKADGGLRDALSMFDLNVTFSKDNTLHYAEVLENLHILDYDYYFKMTDALMESKVAEAYLLFDEILKKGFDGHQFVVGLLEHFRNLLVCKDPVTVKLLQVSESVQQKYLEQSAKANFSFLASALSIGSQCDLNYKSAKNQKLHVEITLLKLAHIPHVLNLSTLPAVEGGAAGKPNTDSSAVVQQPISSPVATSQGTNAVPAQSSNTPAESVPTNTAPIGSIPKVNLGGLKSTANLGKSAVATTKVPSAPMPVLEETQVVQNKTFTKEQLKVQWDSFVQWLKSRERFSEFVILNRDFTLEGTTIHLAVDNEIQVELLTTALRTEVLTHLRKAMQNSTIHIEVSILKEEEKPMIYTQAEKFKFLASKNPALNDLRNALGLDYDY